MNVGVYQIVNIFLESIIVFLCIFTDCINGCKEIIYIELLPMKLVWFIVLDGIYNIIRDTILNIAIVLFSDNQPFLDEHSVV